MNDDEKIEAIACAVHMANRACCLAQGDGSQPTWEEADESMRKASIEAARGALNGDTPEKSHERWMAGKLEAGWKCGPTDKPNKVHADLVPYSDLPASALVKDAVVVSTTRSLAKLFGLAISAALLFLALLAAPAQAANTNLTVSSTISVNPGWSTWCGNSYCDYDVYVSVANVSSQLTSAHLHYGTASGDSPGEVIAAAAVDSSGNFVSSLGFVVDQPYTTVGGGDTLTTAWRIASRVVGGNSTIYYRITLRFYAAAGSPPYAAYLGDRNFFDVACAGGDTDTSPSGNDMYFQPGFP